MPHLEHKVAVIKAPDVRLPSNLVAVYDHMVLEDPAPAINSLFEQLRVWDFDIPDSPAPTAEAVDELQRAADHAPLLELFRLGDEEGNRRRIRWWMASHTKPEQEVAVERVLDVVRDPHRWTAAENAAFVLDYLAALDLGLFPTGLLDELSRNPDFTVRSVAASILWTAATIAPGVAPLDIIMRLIVEGEDWYVVRPAQRALQQLALSRADAMQVLMDLAEDNDRDRRVFATKAFAEIARIRPASVPRSVVETLAQEADVEIRDDARRALAQMADDVGTNWQWEFGEFSTF
jgi:hypothetical protein